MSMEKRAALAFILSMLVILGWQAFFSPPPKDTGAPDAGLSNAAKAPDAPTMIASSGTPVPAETPLPLDIPQTQGASVEGLSQGLRQESVTIETPLYKARLSNQGGTIEHWELKGYRDREGRNIELLPRGTRKLRPLAVGAGGDYGVSEALYTVRGGDIVLDENRPTGTVVFEYSAGGRSIRRTYEFRYDGYDFRLNDQVQGISDYGVTLGPEFGIHDTKEDSLTHTGPLLLQGSDLEEFKREDVEERSTFSEGIKWIALEDKYFCAALVPDAKGAVAEVWAEDGSALISLGVQGHEASYTIYAGPKDYDGLKALGIGLEHIVNFGFFSPIAHPIFWLLKWLYGFVGNYGWAIVLLTIIVRIPFIPIVNKGQRSMKKLQELQPKMQQLREQYKNDSKRLNDEMMKMYRTHQVNPVGGCLPMLLQIPVFFALYKVLLVAIELRDAPFMLWIVDLSQKDPFYVMPIVMGITMVIQQKMTPTGGDPKQQKIMMFMPVIFTFLFLQFASGLVLYWLVNNLLSIAQQLYVNRQKTA